MDGRRGRERWSGAFSIPFEQRFDCSFFFHCCCLFICFVLSLSFFAFALFVAMRTELGTTQHTAIAYKAVIVGLFHAITAFRAVGLVDFMAGLWLFIGPVVFA